MNRTIFLTGIVFGVLAVVLGAFGAHGLEELVDAEAIQEKGRTENLSKETLAKNKQLERESLDAKKAEQAAEKESKAAEQEAMLERALESVASFVNSANKDVDFLVDEDSGKHVVKVIDRESKELIRQFPSDEIISMASKIRELQEELTSKTGLFLDENV